MICSRCQTNKAGYYFTALNRWGVREPAPLCEGCYDDFCGTGRTGLPESVYKNSSRYIEKNLAANKLRILCLKIEEFEISVSEMTWGFENCPVGFCEIRGNHTRQNRF